MSGGRRESDVLESSCTWTSAPDSKRHDPFLRAVLQFLLDQVVFKGTSRDVKVVEWMSPEDLSQAMDVKIREEGTTHSRLLKLLEEVAHYSVKTGHPYFINQLYSSLDVYGLVGQWLTDALNPSVYTFEVAPVFTLMEIEVLSAMAELVGYTTHDGLFSPGGSMSNLYGMLLARHSLFPEAKQQGMSGLGRLVALCSQDAHYSILKGAIVMGLGSNNLVLVRTDDRGRMDPHHLQECISKVRKEGANPFMVCATAGTTVLGAYDPLEEVADICASENLWLHVDAAWGGGALLSSKHKHKLAGIHRADSITWNPHKLMACPQQCSVFLTRHKGLLSLANSAHASYLFQKDKFYDTSYDVGDKYLQCGRRADVLKLWTMWKAKGTKGFEYHIDHVFKMAEYFVSKVRETEGYKLVLKEPECTNVCFWYYPPSLQGLEGQKDFKQKLHKVAPLVKERMVKTGTMMVTYQPLHDKPNFFRLVLQNSAVTKDDMDYFLKKIQELAQDL
ncbi:glutamate decarboxylase-like protein black [Oratosquilla oratoria]|uniref:glutamate decarboxylase-like protein black n=1 Tax=Oratosquilla oratoria TaxID=337810 RepID=UPI003F77098C